MGVTCNSNKQKYEGSAFKITFKSQCVLDAHWLLWFERHLQSPITILRRLRWANGVREKTVTSTRPMFLSLTQSTNLHQQTEDSAKDHLETSLFPRMPWCVVRRQPQGRRGCRQPETKICTKIKQSGCNCVPTEVYVIIICYLPIHYLKNSSDFFPIFKIIFNRITHSITCMGFSQVTFL